MKQNCFYASRNSFVISCVLSLGLTAATSASASTEKKGTIATETWTAQGNPYVITGDIKITGELILEAGTEIIVESGDTSDDNLGDVAAEVEFLIEGTLTVNGTEAEPVTMESNAGTSNYYQGIYLVDDDAEMNATHFHVAHAFSGLRLNANGDVTWDHGSITYTDYGIVNSFGNLTISNLTIQYWYYGGLYIRSLSNISRSSIVDKRSNWNGGARAIDFSDSTNGASVSMVVDHCVLGDSTYFLTTSKDSIGSSFSISNSIILNSSHAFAGSNPTLNTSIDTNLFYNSAFPGSSTNSISGNPLFAGNITVPGSTTDFRITSNSPARRAMLVTEDVNDVLGRYPYQEIETGELVGYLYDDVTVAAGETAIVTGDLRILPNTTFTVEGGGLVQMNGGDVFYGHDDPAKTEIVVEAGGHISIVDASETERAIFAGASSARNFWRGLRYLSGSQVQLDYVDIRDTYHAVYADAGSGSVSITNSLFSNCDDWAVLAYDGRNSTLSHNRFSGTACRVHGADGTHDVSFNIGEHAYRDIFSYTFNDATSHLSFHHNTVRGASNSGYAALYFSQDSPSSTYDIRDNNLIRGHCAFRKNNGSYTPHHNNTWSNSGDFCSGVLSGEGNISQNPLMVDDSNGGDFALTSNSPLRLQASDGTDIGAVPYAGAPTTNNSNVFYGTLVEDTLFATGQEYFISGDLVVPSGVTLTIEPNATVRFGPGDVMGSGVDTARTELIVYGSLVAEGASGGLIQMLSGNVNTPGDNDWYGIRLLEGSTGHKLSYIHVEHAATPIYLHADEPMTLDYLNIVKNRDSENGRVLLTLLGTGPYELKNSTFEGGRQAIRVGSPWGQGSDADPIVFSAVHNTIYNYYSSGLILDFNNQAAFGHIEHNTFFSDGHGNTFANEHVWVRRSAVDLGVTLKNNIFASNVQFQGIDATSSSYAPTAHNNLFYSRWYQNESGTHFMRNWKDWKEDGTNGRGNPLFLDEESWNFGLTPESPARFLADDGSDVGAHQFVEGNPSAGLVGIIRDHRTLEAQIQPHILQGDLIIAEGASLTIEPGAEVHFTSGDDYEGGLDGNRVEITVQGELFVGGGSAQTVLRGINSETEFRTWYGIHIDNTGSLPIFENVGLHNTNHGLLINGEGLFNIQDVHMTYFYETGVKVEGLDTFTDTTTVNISNSLFEYSYSTSANAIRIIGSDDSITSPRSVAFGVERSLFRSIGGNSVYFDAISGNDSVLVNHNTFYETNRAVLYSATEPNNASFVVNNAISKSGGTVYSIHTSGSFHPVVTNNLVWRPAVSQNPFTSKHGNDRAAFLADHNIQENPIFADPDAYDFEPTHRSPLRFGSSEGNDIGAFDFTGTPTPELMGWIHENESLSNSATVFLAGDLTILPGRTLTVAAGTDIQVADTDAAYGNNLYAKTEILVHGVLDARGSRLEPIVFRSFDTVSPGRTDWGGIYIQEESPDQDFSYLDVRDCSNGFTVRTDSAVTVQNSTLHHLGSTGITQVPSEGSLSVSHSRLHDIAGSALVLEGFQANIRNNVIYNNTSTYAIFLKPDSAQAGDYAFIGNTVAKNHGGVRVENRTTDSINVINNVFFNNTNTHGFITYGEDGAAALVLPVVLNNNLTGNGAGNSYTNMSPLDSSNLQLATVDFVDDANNNFRLLDSSGLIDQGVASFVQTGETDFDGRPRIAASTIGGPELTDIGAFEYSVETILVLASSPSRIPQGASVEVTVIGQGFDTLNATGDGGTAPDWSVGFSGQGYAITDIAIVDDTTLTMNVTMDETAQRGLRDLILNDGLTDITLFSALEVFSGPTIESLSVASVKQDTTTNITLTGTNFLSGATIGVSGAGVIVSNATVVSETEAVFTLSTNSTAPIELRDVTLTNPDGGLVVLPAALEIEIKDPPPQLSSVAPEALSQGETAVFTLTGADFLDGASVSVAGIDLTVTNTEFVSSTTINIEVQATQTASILSRNVTVTNPDGQFDTLANALNVTGILELTAMAPNQLVLGQENFQTTLTGQGLMPGMTFSLKGPGDDLVSVSVDATYLDSTSYWLYVTVDDNAPLGGYTLLASAPDGNSEELLNAVEVTAGTPPALSQVNPARLVAGTSFIPIQITGSAFREGFELAFTTDDINIESASFTSSTQIDAVISVAADSTPGPRDLSISIPLAGSADLITAVNIEEPVSILSMSIDNGLDPILPAGANGVTFRVVGTNVGKTFDIGFSGAVTGLSPAVAVTDDEITFTGNIDAAAAPGLYDFTLSLNGQEVASLAQSLQVITPPNIVGVTPDPVWQEDSALPITVNGTDLPDDSLFAFAGTGVTVESASWSNPIAYDATISVDAQAPIGPQTLNVVLSNGYVWPTTGAMTILPSQVSITSIEPSTLPQDAGLVTLTLTGQQFVAGGISSFEFDSSSLIDVVGTPTIVSDTQATIDVSVPADALLGSHDITAFFGLYDVAVGVDLLEVVPEVEVASVDPNALTQGQQNQTLTVYGSGFADQSTVSFVGGDIEVTNTTFISSSELEITVNVDQNALVGLQDVEINFPTGYVHTEVGVLEVQAGPQVTVVTPYAVLFGSQNECLTVVGTALTDDMEWSFSGDAVTVVDTTWDSSTLVTLCVDVAAVAASGNRDLILTRAADNLELNFPNSINLYDSSQPVPTPPGTNPPGTGNPPTVPAPPGAIDCSNEPPELQVCLATPLFFSVTQFGGVSPYQSVYVDSDPLGANWIASANQPWILLAATTGSAQNFIDVAVDSATLAVGSSPYNGQITVRQYDPLTGLSSDPTRTIDVTVNVSTTPFVGDPRLEVIPTSIEVTIYEGEVMSPATFQVRSQDQGVYPYAALVSDSSIMQLSSTTGETPDNINLVVDTSALTASVFPYAYTIQLVAPDLEDSPIEVAVRVFVDEIPPPGQLLVVPSEAVLSADENATDPVLSTLDVTALGGTDVSYTVDVPPDATWLSVDTASLNTPEQVLLSADPTGLTFADSPYETVLTFTSEINDVIDVPVRLLIGTEPPTAHAGEDRNVAPTVVQLNGYGSLPDPDYLDFQWTQLSGPETVVLNDETTYAPHFIARTAGDYTFELMVTDSDNISSAPDSVTITVRNVAPNSFAGVDLVHQLSNASAVLTLYGDRSGDGNGDSISYDWMQTGGPTVVLTDSTSARTDFTVVQAGHYGFTLTVTDAEGNQSSDHVSYIVQADGDTVPTAIVTAPDSALTNETLTLDGSASSHSGDGEPLSYSWRQVSGPAGQLDGAFTEVATFETSQEGVGVFELIVSDGTHTSIAEQVTVEFNSALTSVPTANSFYTTRLKEFGTPIELDASPSETGAGGAGGDFLTYQWGLLEGLQTELMTPQNADPISLWSANPPAIGVYQFSLVVREDGLGSAPTQMWASVNSDTEHMPVASIVEVDQAFQDVAMQLSTLDTQDQDGQALSYRWTQTEGPKVGLDDPTAQSPNLQPTILGHYTFQLRVDDGAYLSPPVTVSFEVVEAENQSPVADAGPDTVGTVGDVIVLDGSNSSDPNGDDLTYSWQQIGGAESLILEDTQSAQLSFTTNTPGLYQLELIVNDGELDSLPSTVLVSVLPIESGVDLAPNHLFFIVEQGGLPSEPQTITVTAAANSDSDSFTVVSSYAWLNITQDNQSVPGEFTVSVDPTNLLAATPVVHGTIDVQVPGYGTESVPVIVSILDKLTDSPTLNVAPLSFNMTIQEGQSVDPMNIQVSALDNGEYTFFVVSDDTDVLTINSGDETTPETLSVALSSEGLVAQSDPYVYSVYLFSPNLENSPQEVLISVQVNAPEPMASMYGNPSQISLSAEEGSTSWAGVVLRLYGENQSSVDWTLTLPVDAPWLIANPGAGRTPSILSVAADPTGLTEADSPFSADLTFTTSENETIIVPVTLHIGATPPTAVVGATQTTAPSWVTLDGSQSSSDDGSDLTFQWVQTAGASVVLDDDTAISPRFAASQAGQYLFELTVTDESGRVSTPATSEVYVRDVAPIANAGQDLAFRLETESRALRLYGSQSVDGNGEDLAYQWRQLDGPQVEINGPNGAEALATVTTAGVYRFELEVSDAGGQRNSQVVTYVVDTPEDSIPNAHIIAPERALVGELIELDGSMSHHGGDGQSLAYEWAIVEGSDVEIADDQTWNESTLTLSGESPGILVIQLLVSDGLRRSPAAQVSIAIDGATDEVPVAAFAEEQSVGSPGDELTIDATVSTVGPSTQDNASLAYSFGQTRGPFTQLTMSQTDGLQTFQPVFQGLYQFSVRVSTAVSPSLFATQWSLVNGANTIPSSTGAASGDLKVDTVVQLQADTTMDADGDALTYRWSQVSGPWVGLDDPVISNPTFTPRVAGEYVFDLWTNDGTTDGPPSRVSVTVEENPNQIPLAHAGDSQEAYTETVVVLDGSLSSDPDDDPLTYLWSQKDGPVTVAISDATSETASFVGYFPGVYTFELIVEDGQVASLPAEVAITLTREDGEVGTNAPPTAFVADEVTGSVGAEIELDGTGSSDPDGDTLTYEWSVVASPESVTLLDADTHTARFTPGVQGLYEFQLTVSDGSYSASAQTTVIASAHLDNQAPEAVAGENQSIELGEETKLDGSASFDPDGDDLTFNWRQLTGPVLLEGLDWEQSVIPLTLNHSGPYQFELTVSDGLLESRDQVVIGVSAVAAGGTGDAGVVDPDPQPDAGSGGDNNIDDAGCACDANADNQALPLGEGLALLLFVSLARRRRKNA